MRILLLRAGCREIWRLWKEQMRNVAERSTGLEDHRGLAQEPAHHIMCEWLGFSLSKKY